MEQCHHPECTDPTLHDGNRALVRHHTDAHKLDLHPEECILCFIWKELQDGLDTAMFTGIRTCTDIPVGDFTKGE